jgi:hypothetical protein
MVARDASAAVDDASESAPFLGALPEDIIGDIMMSWNAPPFRFQSICCGAFEQLLLNRAHPWQRS